MKKEMLQQTLQKYKGTKETTTNNYMPIQQTTQKKGAKFLERYNLPRLNWEETETLSRLIASTEIEIVIKKLPINKSPGIDDFHYLQVNSIKHLEKLTSILLKLFQKIPEEGTLPSSFYEAIITLILRPDIDTTHTHPHTPLTHKITGQYQ